MQSLPGAGIANVRGIEEGKAEVGFANTITTADAVAGTGEAAARQEARQGLQRRDALSAVLPGRGAGRQPASTRIKDVKGKGFATQVKGNTGELIARHVLRVSGMTYSDVKASFTNSYTDSVEQMKDNRMHMFALGTGIPASSIMDLASARDIQLLDMSAIYEDMSKINPAYKLVTVPKGTYPKQDKDVQVIGYYTHVIAACSLPEDTVYKMTAAIHAQQGRHGGGLQGHGQADPAGHVPGHRRAVPPWRRQVVQGTGHHGEIATTRRRRGGAEPPPSVRATGQEAHP